MTSDPNRVQAIFLLAIERPTPEGRAAVLDAECGLNDELRGRIEALLLAHDRPGCLLDRPIVLPSHLAEGDAPPPSPRVQGPDAEELDSASPLHPRGPLP